MASVGRELPPEKTTEETPRFSLLQATAGDRERLYRIQSQAMRPYVEQIWGWDEGFQREGFRRRFDPSTTQVVLSNDREIGFLRVAEDQGFMDTAREAPYSVIADYAFPGIESEALATVLGGAIGVTVIYLLLAGGAYLAYRAVSNRKVESSDYC